MINFNFCRVFDDHTSGTCLSAPLSFSLRSSSILSSVSAFRAENPNTQFGGREILGMREIKLRTLNICSGFS